MWSLHGCGPHLGIVEPDVFAVVRHAFAGHEARHDFERVLEEVGPLAYRRERDSQRPVLGLEPR
jgi:hypothetical protein